MRFPKLKKKTEKSILKKKNSIQNIQSIAVFSTFDISTVYKTKMFQQQQKYRHANQGVIASPASRACPQTTLALSKMKQN